MFVVVVVVVVAAAATVAAFEVLATAVADVVAEQNTLSQTADSPGAAFVFEVAAAAAAAAGDYYP